VTIYIYIHKCVGTRGGKGAVAPFLVVVVAVVVNIENIENMYCTGPLPDFFEGDSTAPSLPLSLLSLPLPPLPSSLLFPSASIPFPSLFSPPYPPLEVGPLKSS